MCCWCSVTVAATGKSLCPLPSRSPKATRGLECLWLGAQADSQCTGGWPGGTPQPVLCVQSGPIPGHTRVRPTGTVLSGLRRKGAALWTAKGPGGGGRRRCSGCISSRHRHIGLAPGRPLRQIRSGHRPGSTCRARREGGRRRGEDGCRAPRPAAGRRCRPPPGAPGGRLGANGRPAADRTDHC